MYVCIIYIWYTVDQHKHGEGKAKTCKMPSFSKNDVNDWI